MSEGNPQFDQVISGLSDYAKEWHQDDLIQHALQNQAVICEGKSVKALPSVPSSKSDRAVVVSAGPSLHRFKGLETLRDSNFEGNIVCVDGSYLKCIKAGIIPDYMVTLDPHPTRMVRWFGDHEFEKNSEGDDFFNRQDLDVDFRNNSIKENQKNIELINEYAPQTKLIICSSAPANVVARCLEAKFDMYWWNPLVDDPNSTDSLTKKLYAINPIPCMNTGGTVGSAAWVFAHSRLKAKSIGLMGMDMGYHMDTPYEMTQTWREIKHHVESQGGVVEDFFPKVNFPLDGMEYYLDPTYFFYRKNLLEMMEQSKAETFNCSQAGTLFGPQLQCMTLSDFLK